MNAGYPRESLRLALSPALLRRNSLYVQRSAIVPSAPRPNQLILSHVQGDYATRSVGIKLDRDCVTLVSATSDWKIPMGGIDCA